MESQLAAEGDSRDPQGRTRVFANDRTSICSKLIASSSRPEVFADEKKSNSGKQFVPLLHQGNNILDVGSDRAPSLVGPPNLAIAARPGEGSPPRFNTTRDNVQPGEAIAIASIGCPVAPNL